MTKLTLENFADRENAASGLIRREDVRRVELEALVDTGATTLVLPADIARKLGVPFRDRKTARMAEGSFSEVAVEPLTPGGTRSRPS
jgi:predicted aspartyl protease